METVHSTGFFTHEIHRLPILAEDATERVMLTLNWKALAAVIAAGLTTVLGLSTCYYRNSYLHEKQKSENAVTLAEQRQRIITDMQLRQREVAALDKKYTQELIDAKRENALLRDDVAAGRRRLRIRAACPGVPKTTTARVDDAEAARFDETTEQAYFRLREMIVANEKQLLGLQQYVREQCQ